MKVRNRHVYLIVRNTKDIPINIKKFIFIRIIFYAKISIKINLNLVFFKDIKILLH